MILTFSNSLSIYSSFSPYLSPSRTPSPSCLHPFFLFFPPSSSRQEFVYSLPLFSLPSVSEMTLHKVRNSEFLGGDRKDAGALLPFHPPQNPKVPCLYFFFHLLSLRFFSSNRLSLHLFLPFHFLVSSLSLFSLPSLNACTSSTVTFLDTF